MWKVISVAQPCARLSRRVRAICATRTNSRELAREVRAKCERSASEVRAGCESKCDARASASQRDPRRKPRRTYCGRWPEHTLFVPKQPSSAQRNLAAHPGATGVSADSADNGLPQGGPQWRSRLLARELAPPRANSRSLASHASVSASDANFRFADLASFLPLSAVRPRSEKPRSSRRIVRRPAVST